MNKVKEIIEYLDSGQDYMNRLNYISELACIFDLNRNNFSNRNEWVSIMDTDVVSVVLDVITLESIYDYLQLNLKNYDAVTASSLIWAFWKTKDLRVIQLINLGMAKLDNLESKAYCYQSIIIIEDIFSMASKSYSMSDASGLLELIFNKHFDSEKIKEVYERIRVRNLSL